MAFKWKKLQVTQHKSEIVIMYGKRQLKNIGDDRIRSENSIRYRCNIIMKDHINYAIQNLEKTKGALADSCQEMDQKHPKAVLAGAMPIEGIYKKGKKRPKLIEEEIQNI